MEVAFQNGGVKLEDKKRVEFKSPNHAGELVELNVFFYFEPE